MMSFESKGPLERCIFIVRGSFNPPIFHPDWFSRHRILPGEEVEGLMSELKAKEIPEMGITLLYGQRFLVGSDQTVLNFKSFKLIVTRDRFETRCGKRKSFPLMLTLVRTILRTVFMLFREWSLRNSRNTGANRFREFRRLHSRNNPILRHFQKTVRSIVRKVFKILQETPVSAYGINFEEHFTFGETPEKLIGKFFTKKEHVNQIFGDDAQYGYTILTNEANAKVTFCHIAFVNFARWYLFKTAFSL